MDTIMKKNRIILLLGTSILIGCAASDNNNNGNIIRAHGIDTEFHIDEESNLINKLDYYSVNTVSPGILNNTHTIIKTFKNEDGELTHAFITSCNNCNYNLNPSKSVGITFSVKDKKNTYQSQVKLKEIYKKHSIKGEVLKNSLPDTIKSTRSELCLNYYTSNTDKVKLRVGTIQECRKTPGKVENVQLVSLD